MRFDEGFDLFLRALRSFAFGLGLAALLSGCAIAGSGPETACDTTAAPFGDRGVPGVPQVHPPPMQGSRET